MSYKAKLIQANPCGTEKMFDERCNSAFPNVDEGPDAVKPMKPGRNNFTSGALYTNRNVSPDNVGGYRTSGKMPMGTESSLVDKPDEPSYAQKRGMKNDVPGM